jgi:hypothetical protein
VTDMIEENGKYKTRTFSSAFSFGDEAG